MPSVWAARGRSQALWSPGGGKLKVCHLRVSQVWVRQGCLQRCLACPRCGRVGISQAGQILVQVLVLVAGTPCPTPEAAVGWGRRWGDIWQGGIGRLPLSPPACCSPQVSHSPRVPRGGQMGRRRRAGGRASPSACVGWVGCRRQLCAQELVRKRAGIQELPRETLSDALYAPRDLLPPLLCPPRGCRTHPQVPLSPLYRVLQRSVSWVP